MAANAAIITSLSINFWLKVFKIGLPYGIDIGAFSLFISLFVFITISFMTSSDKINPDVEAVMDL
jgi:hypothetical protein